MNTTWENPEHPDGSQPIVLIIDDEPTNLEMMSNCLAGLGLEVLIARSGESGLDRAEYSQPDLILLDVMMPGIDGFETCRWLKANEALRDIPVLFMTALTETQDKVKGFNLGGVDYITKPFQIEEVLARVKTHLTLHAIQKRLEAQNVQLQQEITERKQAEEALQKAYDELDQRVEQRTAELAQANIKLKEEITERKRAEEALRGSEQRYHSLFEDTPFPLWEEDYSQVKAHLENLRASGITDLRAYFEDHPEAAADCAGLVKVLDVNKATVALVGARNKEELLAGLPEGFTATSLQAFGEQLVTLAEGGREFQSEATYRKLTGEEQVVLLHLGVAPGYESSLGRVLVSMLDVTERRRAEEALRESEERFQQVAEHAQEWIWEVDAHGLYTYASPVVERILGYKPEEIVGKKHFYDLFHPEDREELREAAFEVFARKQPFREFVNRNVRKDGETVWLSTSGVSILDEVGDLLGYRGTDTDITQRKQAEEALARQNRRLAALYHTGQMINSTLEVDVILEHLVDEALRAIHATHGQVLVVQEEVGCFERHSLRGFSPEEAKRARTIPLSLEQGLSGEAYRTKQPVCVDDVRANLDHYPLIPNTRAELVVPILHEGQVLGNLDLQSPEVGAFREVDLNYLNALADQVAIALENARLYETEQRRAREAAAVSAIAQALNASTDLTSVFQAVSRELGRVVGFDRASLALFSDDQQHFTMRALSDREGAPLSPGVTMPTEATAAATDVLAGQPHLTPDLSTELDFPGDRALHEAGFRSRLNLPLVLGEVVIGALNLASRELNAFSPAQLPVLSQVADAIAAAMQNARLYEETQRRNRELALLNRVIAASAAGETVDSVLETACQELALAFGVPQSAAALFNEKKTEAVVMAEYLAEGRPPSLGEVIPAVGNPAFQHLLKHKTPLAIEDAQTDPRQAPTHDLMRRRGTVSLLLLPLIIQGEVVGSLEMDAIELHPFSAEEVALAQRVAEQVSVVLARVRLQETQRRLSTAVEQGAEATFITDTKGTILYVNPAFERITGYRQAEAVGQQPRFFRSSKHDAAFFREMWQTLAAGQVWQGRITAEKKDGGSFTVDTTATAVRDQAGKIANYVASMRDATREMELEEQFRQAQKMEAIGRLAGGIAHDFNNLLTVIHLSTRLLERKLHARDPLLEHVKRIQEAGGRATNLVRQLLRFSRREIIEPKTLNLNDVIGDLSKMLRRVIGEDIELELALADDLWPVYMDPTQVDQVIMNLAVNARDAMLGGGILTIETANVFLDTEYVARHVDAQPGEHVLLAISDTGVGMDSEVKAHLFEPFFTTKEPRQGTGLGLATVYGIVRQNQGNIWVYSEPGQGTTFKIYLPHRAEAEAQKMPGRSRLAAAATARGTETILLVEDEANVRGLTAHVLKAQGYQVLAAQDGEEALHISEQHGDPIHLLVTDVVMPRMSGRELAERLKSRRPEMRVLYMSGYTDNAITLHGVLEKGIAFLSKPFTLEGLLQKVRAVLGDEP